MKVLAAVATMLPIHAFRKPFDILASEGDLETEESRLLAQREFDCL